MASAKKLSGRYLQSLQAAQSNRKQLTVTWPGASPRDRITVSAILADTLPKLIDIEVADMQGILERATR